MRLIVVVGAMIFTSLLVSVGSTSTGTSNEDLPEFQDRDFNDTLDMLEDGLSELESHSSERQARASYPLYKGFIMGCYKQRCFRYKRHDSSTWDYLERWDYKPGQAVKYVLCKNHQNCIDYANERPNDFPCYVSRWSEYPCYKGRRYGCRHSWSSYNDRCWCETLQSPWWDYALDSIDDRIDTCTELTHTECLNPFDGHERCRAKIDDLGEF